MNVFKRFCFFDNLIYTSINRNEPVINSINGNVFTLSYIFSKIETHALYCASLEVSCNLFQSNGVFCALLIKYSDVSSLVK